MTSRSSAIAIVKVLVLLVSTIFCLQSAHALGGSATTVAVSYGASTTICSIQADQPTQHIQCWRAGEPNPIPIFSNVSFDTIAGGADLLCGVRSGGTILICWDAALAPKRIYYNESTPLSAITIGDTQICGLTNATNSTTGNTLCWRGDGISSPSFSTISSGLGFNCGVLENNGRVVCWGRVDIASTIQSAFANRSMRNIFVGGQHACGVNTTGFVNCEGNNENGQLNLPSNLADEYTGMALGANHSCAIRGLNNTVVCWGGRNGEFSSNLTDGISFESIVAGLDFTCGLTSGNFSIICWGPGWRNTSYPSGVAIPLGKTLPGPCVERNCSCGIYPQSQQLCSGNGNICRPCPSPPLPIPPPSSPQPPVVSPSPSSPSRGLRRGLLAFAIVGSVGAFSGICTIIYCLWTGVCFGKKKIHNSVQPTITTAGSNPAQQSSSSPTIFSRSSTLRRQSSRLMRRQRSGTSTKHTERAEEFLFSDLDAATNGFALENKIGAGSFGIVYRGKLPDGREVAIKRGETSSKTKKLQEKESAFESELAFLSRLHHKHLVRLVGYCEERDERLLVYDYMKNGALYDHLHNMNNVENSSSLVNSWRMRIKIALDAARGIEYLHNYAVPPIIHRDIKSSNILLDENWTARVSDFGLSLMSSESDRDFVPTKAAGTIGYIDPESYSLNVLTAKSDVYGLGVVLLELLTGKKALFKSAESGSSPIILVDYAVPTIQAGEMVKILDPRVGPPDLHESEAVELVGYTAMHCVSMQGKDRPTMADIVANLERALALCDDTNGSISSDPLSVVSE